MIFHKQRCSALPAKATDGHGRRDEMDIILRHSVPSQIPIVKIPKDQKRRAGHLTAGNAEAGTGGFGKRTANISDAGAEAASTKKNWGRGHSPAVAVHGYPFDAFVSSDALHRSHLHRVVFLL